METTKQALKDFFNDMVIDKSEFELNEDLNHLKRRLKDRIILEPPFFE